jgi:hypothetical protein
VVFAYDVTRRINGREHRVILIVVAMQTVPSYRLKIAYGFKITANCRQALLILLVIDRVGLFHAYDSSIFNFVRFDQVYPGAFLNPQFYQAIL